MKALAILAVFAGCGARAPTSLPPATPPAPLATATTAAPSNVIAVTVDHSSHGQNLPEITVTICTPGTQTCQSIPHIVVDTASTGLRLYSAAVNIDLPAETDSRGASVADCAWNHWGYIHTADVQLGGLKAPAVPIHIIETSDATRPPNCAADHDYDPSTYNGIIGVSPALTDTMPGAYFTCAGNHCEQAPVDRSLQVANVVASFPSDNNGCIVQFPEIPDTGTESVTGRIIFGIGTRTNNRPPSDLVPIVPDETWGQIKVEVDGRLWTSAFDTGTWSYNVPYLSHDVCPTDSIHLCPSSPLTIAVDVLHASGDVAFRTSIRVVNYSQLSPQVMALNNVGTAWPGFTQFLLGLPYFFGRSIFYAFDQRPTSLGVGPWIGAR